MNKAIEVPYPLPLSPSGHRGERWQSESLVIYPPPLRRFICEMFRSLVANLRIYELYAAFLSSPLSNLNSAINTHSAIPTLSLYLETSILHRCNFYGCNLQLSKRFIFVNYSNLSDFLIISYISGILVLYLPNKALTIETCHKIPTRPSKIVLDIMFSFFILCCHPDENRVWG